MTTPTVKPYILLAKKAPIAVILMRKSSKKYHIIRWNIETDEMTHGSWFDGTLYNCRTDLSFDGKHLVYFVMGDLSKRNHFYCWTAICEPPSLRAKVLFDHEDTWRGGGIFWGDDGLDLYLDASNHPRTHKQPRKMISNHRVEKAYRLQPITQETELPFPVSRFSYILCNRLIRNGWRDVSDSTALYNEGWKKEKREIIELEKNLTAGRNAYKLRMKLKSDWIKSGRYSLFDYTLFDENNSLLELINQEVIWADWDMYHRLIFVKNGIIYRCEQNDLSRFSVVLDCNLIEKHRPFD